LQAKLTEAQQAAAKAEAEKQAAITEERAKLEDQVRAAQADNLGAETALKREDNPSAEVRLALRMTQRVSLKLATAIGKLPHDQQLAMVELIEQALSDKQSEVDAANRKLEAMDADFRAITAEREHLKSEIPKLTERAVKAEETVLAVQSEVTAKTEEVKKVADKLYQADMARGSLMANIKNGIMLLVGAYLLVTILLPALVKHLDSGNPTKNVLRNISGYLANPLLYHDASKKIKALKSNESSQT
jgi:chromosome segregation ATPase